MKVQLSNSDYLRNFDRFIDKLNLAEPNKLEILTHPKWFSIHPAILTFIATLSQQVGKENVILPNLTATSGSYLDRMGLFNFTDQTSPYQIQYNDPSGRFVPLSVIRTQDEQTQFLTEIVPMLHLEAESANAIRYVVGELVRNVLEHSHSPYGAIVAAQYYKKSNTIRIGICDGGIGIRKSLEYFWPGHTQNDLDAIKWALLPGVSGTTTSIGGGTSDNAGAGLFFIKSIAKVARNYFMIYSGSGIYRLLLRDGRFTNPRLTLNPEEEHHAERLDAPYFQGTLIAIDLTLDNDIQAFSELLAKIRDNYSSALRQRKKQQYKRFKFL